jgi:toxin CptA
MIRIFSASLISFSAVSSRIDIPLRPSGVVGCLAALPWLVLCGFILILAGTHGISFLVLLPVALAGALYQWNLNGRLSLGRSITRLTITDRGLQAQQRNGTQFLASVGPQSRLYPALIILKLNPDDATYKSISVLLWARNEQSVDSPGNIAGDLHRQLRVWLRLGSAGERSTQSQ